MHFICTHNHLTTSGEHFLILNYVFKIVNTYKMHTFVVSKQGAKLCQMSYEEVCQDCKRVAFTKSESLD